MSTSRLWTLRCGVGLVGLLVVSACVGPEKGDAELTIDKAGGYTFTYHGGMAYLIGLAAKASGKPLRPKDVQGVGAALQSLSKDREFLSVTPAGFSRVNVDYKAVRKPGQSFAFIGDAKFITVSSDAKTHRLVIRSAAITPKNAAQLTRIGYRPDVALTVKSDLPVIASNGAVQRAMLFGHDAYRWQINLTPRPAVDMTVRLPG